MSEHHKQLLEEVNWLREQGHRLTPQRMLVLQIIKAQRQHMTAEEIYDQMVCQQPFSDITTVYRSLQWLQGVGLVSPITIGDGRQRFEYRRPDETHHHLICQRCGGEIQVPDDLLAPFCDAIRERYGFDMHAEHLAFHGVCAACKGLDA